MLRMIRSVLVVFLLALVFSFPAAAQEATEQEETMSEGSFGQQETEGAAQSQYEDEAGASSGQQIPVPTVPGPDSECPGAEVVATLTGTGPEQSAPFQITGTRVRITVANEPTSQDPSVSGVTVRLVEDQTDDTAATFAKEGAGTESSIANIGPGSFYIDTNPANADYAIAIEDCKDTGQTQPTNPSNPGASTGNPGNVPSNVIVSTIPKKTLANTGGPSMLLPLAGLLLGAGVLGFAALRRR